MPRKTRRPSCLGAHAPAHSLAPAPLWHNGWAASVFAPMPATFGPATPTSATTPTAVRLATPESASAPATVALATPTSAPMPATIGQPHPRLQQHPPQPHLHPCLQLSGSHIHVCICVRNSQANHICVCIRARRALPRTSRGVAVTQAPPPAPTRTHPCPSRSAARPAARSVPPRAAPAPPPRAHPWLLPAGRVAVGPGWPMAGTEGARARCQRAAQGQGRKAGGRSLRRGSR